MKQRPILFSTPMVQAILEGRKTQTRRIVKAHLDDRGLRWGPKGWEDWHGSPVRCPYGQPGDILWVRETWKPKYVKGGLYGFRLQYPDVHPWFYAAEGESEKGYGRWKPSIHMPREAARIFLRITDIRVERLQDITEEDAISEGYKPFRSGATSMYSAGIDHKLWRSGAIPWFANIWQSINGPDSWQTNPLVWVVSFECENRTEPAR